MTYEREFRVHFKIDAKVNGVYIPKDKNLGPSGKNSK